jgi:NIPSNAP
MPLRMQRCCSIIELRQYTLHQGMRDTLIALFDREFVESQESLGMRIIGHFRDLDDPNRFVWLRGFDSMATRGKALAAFYGGPVWQAHRDAANATMIDSDNVLLLRPGRADSGFDLAGRTRESSAKSHLITANIQYIVGNAGADFIEFFEAEMQPRIEAAGARILATLVTDSSPNNFPALPLRDREHVLAWFERHDSETAHLDYLRRLRRATDWREVAPFALLPQFMRKAEVLRLTPSARSLLR